MSRRRAVSARLIGLGVAAITAVGCEPRTKYAPNFSKVAFEKLQPGTSKEEVIAALGEPLSRRTNAEREAWCFGEVERSAAEKESSAFATEVRFDARPGPPCILFDHQGVAIEALRDRDGGLASLIGRSRTEVETKLGKPTRTRPASVHTVLYFSAPAGDDDSYENYSVVLDERGRVVRTVHYTLWD